MIETYSILLVEIAEAYNHISYTGTLQFCSIYFQYYVMSSYRFSMHVIPT